MRVSEMAEQVGTSAKTIRFYEAEGILPSPPRAANGYRDYADADVCRARMVVALRGLGIDLAEAGRLAGLCASGRCDDTMVDLAATIPQRRRAIADAIAELRHADSELEIMETALARGTTPITLCARKEDC